MIINDNFQILSEHTLWVIGEDNEPQRCQNSYNNMEIIRVSFSDRSYRDYPIEDEVTIVPPLALIFFKKEEDAARFSQIIDSEQGLDIIVSNSENSSRRSNLNEQFKHTMKEGVYCIPYFDDSLDENSWLREIRWLDSEMNIKKPIPAEEKDKNIFVDYSAMHDCETNTDFRRERLLFEVVCEDGITYINHFKIRQSLITNSDPLYFTRNLQFPIFSSKEDAYWYRYGIEHGANKYDYIIKNQQLLALGRNFYNTKEARKEMIKNIAGIIGNYAWEHSSQILDFVKGVKLKKKKSS